MKKQKNKISAEMTEQINLKLKQYAEEVNRLQTDIESNDALSKSHGKIALELAVKAGDFLRQAKKLVPRGEWEKWLADNVNSAKLRTLQNYMKLAQEKAIAEERKRNEVEFGIKTQINAFYDECQSLGEAYRAVGIIKNIPATDGSGGVEQTPETMKRDNKQKYDHELNAARQKMVAHVRKQIESSTKRLNFNLSTWTIKNNTPSSGDESNFASALFQSLLSWISLRNNSSLTREDEIKAKAGIVLNELVKAILLATAKPKTDDQKPQVEVVDTVPLFSFEPNRQPVDVVEVAEPALA